jgi:hypothetical protein
MRSARFYLWIAISLLAVLVMALGSSTHGQTIVHPAIAVAASGYDFDSDWPIKDQQTIRKSFSLPEGEKSLEIDNITGFIEVTGKDTDQIQLVVNETIRAQSREKLERARQEVALDITQDGGLLKVCVNGPFRCGSGCACNGCSHSDDREGYSVRMDFQLQVPHNILLKLSTVNGGHVQVKDVTGNYSVHNVNGGIEMEDVAGSGTARTVNGSVKVVFRANPRENSDFASVNGSVELYFVPNLSADFRFKTMNGAIFTDFPMTSLPARASLGERHDGRFVFRADRFTGGRVGSGGPEIKAENLNGNIRVLERHD